MLNPKETNSNEKEFTLNTIEEAVADIKAGKVVIVVEKKKPRQMTGPFQFDLVKPQAAINVFSHHE